MKWIYSNDGTRRDEANYIMNYISCMFDISFDWENQDIEIGVIHNGKHISLRKELVEIL